MLSYILETVMLLCFAAAWPASIHKSWVSKTRKGKSLSFMQKQKSTLAVTIFFR